MSDYATSFLVKSAVQSYRCCVVNLQPSRSVHCVYSEPCPVETHAGINCNSVHHGYCVPVSVSIVGCHPNSNIPIAQLSIDTSSLTSETPSFDSPRSSISKPSSVSKRSSWGDRSDVTSSELRLSWSEKSDTSSTCENNSERRPSGSSVELVDTTAELAKLQSNSLSHDLATQVEVAKIAQQITDHAEAIYQTWKQKGLSPEQILNVHSIGCDSKVGKDPLPRVQRHVDRQKPVELNPVNLLASPDLDGKLNELVNNFISEDKARRGSLGNSPSSPLTPTTPPPNSYTSPSTVHLGRQRFENIVKSQSNTLPRSIPFNSAGQRAGSSEPLTEGKSISSSGTWPRTAKASSGNAGIVDSSPARPFLDELSKTIPSHSSSSSMPHFVTNKRIQDDTNSKWLKKTSKQEDYKRYDTLPHDPKSTDLKQLEEDLISALKSGSDRTKDKSSVTLNGAIQDSKQPDSPLQTQEFHSNRNRPKFTYSVAVAGQNDNGLDSPKPSSSTDSSGSRSPRHTDEEFSGLSTVDYAKQRYKAAQKNPLTQQRLALDKQMKQQEHVHTVSETRSRFETGLIGVANSQYRGEWVPSLHTSEDGTKRISRPKVRKSPSPEPQSVSPLPHPELTQMQKQHIRERSGMTIGGVPIRPFLTRGSVAERVLLFEKCPTELQRENKAPTISPNTGPAPYNAWKGTNDVSSKSKFWSLIGLLEKHGIDYVMNYVREGESPPRSPTSTLRRQARRQSTIPRFHFPQGRPSSPQQVDASVQKINKAFDSLPGRQANKQQFGQIAKACDLPMYLKAPLYLAAGGDGQTLVHADTFIELWRRVLSTHHDAAGRLIRILTRGTRSYLLPEDWVPMVQDIVDTHPGLSFLREAQEFHSRYVHTVIARIYYTVNRSWSGQITLNELRRSNLLHVIKTLDITDDINKETNYFSYEHFYVIYCKFWELDTDHDLLIDKNDLSRHNDHAISSRMIDRIFSGAVTRGRNQKEEKMSYTEFIWFLISEEDKRHPTAIEYWFRCMDLDGDGYLSMYELEYFYEEQLQRLEALGIETLPFKDCLCQMLDMLRPEAGNRISLRDLKFCRMTPVFYDTFFNLEKYLDHEHKDPFATQRDPEDAHVCDWERYAAEEYELLVAEEGASEQHEELMYEDEVEGDELSPNLDNIITDAEEYHY